MRRGNGVLGVFILLAAVLVLGRCAPEEGRPRVVELTLQGGVLPADQQVIRLRLSDDVTIVWKTDRPITIHLHGYDIEKTLSPAGPTTMSFRARATGRFPITVHSRGEEREVTLGYLEVYPW